MEIIEEHGFAGENVTQHGSRGVRLVPLFESSSDLSGVMMRLAPGGAIGRHHAASRQLFCVLTGDGWASGADGAASPIGPGQIVLWEAGEEHAVRTTGGLTALVLEGDSVTMEAVHPS